MTGSHAHTFAFVNYLLGMSNSVEIKGLHSSDLRLVCKFVTPYECLLSLLNVLFRSTELFKVMHIVLNSLEVSMEL